MTTSDNPGPLERAARRSRDAAGVDSPDELGATFYLTVDSNNYDEPDPRRFVTLDRALAAFDRLDEEFKRFAWITSKTTGHFPNPCESTVHMRDGELVSHPPTPRETQEKLLAELKSEPWWAERDAKKTTSN